jgi:centromeric protein E
MEIYNEAVRDLLSSDNVPLRLLDDPEVNSVLFFSFFFKDSCDWMIMNIFNSAISLLQKGTVVERLTEVTLRDWDHLHKLLSICQGKEPCVSFCFTKWHYIYLIFVFTVLMFMLLSGCCMLAAERKIGETSLNETSSRSHQILRLVWNIKLQSNYFIILLLFF